MKSVASMRGDGDGGAQTRDVGEARPLLARHDIHAVDVRHGGRSMS